MAVFFYILFKIFCKKYCLLQNKLYICTRVKEVIYTANSKKQNIMSAIIKITDKNLFDSKVKNVNAEGLEARGENFWGLLEITLLNGDVIEEEGDVSWNFNEYGFVINETE